MTLPFWTPVMRRVFFSGAAIVLAASVASAQSQVSSTQSSTSGYSASNESSSLSFDNATVSSLFGLDTAEPSASGGAGAAAGQDYGSGHHGFLHNFTFEGGAGFNGPIGNDTNQYGVISQSNGAPEAVPVITWGGNFTVGGGFRFSKRISALLEYQFIDDKLPGALIAAINNATGGQDDITAGNSHINSITGSPVIDLFPKRSNGAYLVGGFGYYHKSTNFQAPEAEISYYGEYYENVTVASFTSNQWGGNAGLGIYHRLGGVYGDSKTQLFAEARYTFIHTPPPTQDNGLGTTELIPVTFGVRF
jgi:hypothetical protein